MKTFNQIKKYSESYAKMMRDLFPLSFENENLNKILDEIVFDDEKSIFIDILYKDETKILEFKNFIYSKIDIEKKETEVKESVKDLLEQAWYDFYICETKEDVEQFKKYYKKGEELCTFNNINSRLSNYYIFWIVKKDINNISHQWNEKTRQDLYGTSCCSIQINKKNNSDISIKNRYNHSVNNPDATFSNNLDNIIEGLSEAFKNEFHLDFIQQKQAFELDKFIFKNWKLMLFNYEINNIYYWINKIFKDWEFIIYDTNEYILIDYYLIDLKDKKIIQIDNEITDDFYNLKFNKIIIKNKKEFDKDEDIKDTLIIYK